MKTFSVTFNGRIKGALGVTQVFTVEVVAQDILEAVSTLYKTHEHIRLVTHSEVTPPNNRATPAMHFSQSWRDGWNDAVQSLPCNVEQYEKDLYYFDGWHCGNVRLRDSLMAQPPETR